MIRPLGTITIKGIEVFGHHGVVTSEVEHGQPFLVDLEVSLDLGAAGLSDDLADTIDYGDLAHRVHNVVASERWNLIERVAERVVAVVMEDERVKRVNVTVHKPRAPIPVPFEDVAVTVSAVRS
jgi:dihydroneopterin aldolase